MGANIRWEDRHLGIRQRDWGEADKLEQNKGNKIVDISESNQAYVQRLSNQ